MKTRFTVFCRRPTFLLNRLLAAGVLLDKVQTSDGSFAFSTSYANALTVKKLFSEQGVRYRTDGYLGVKNALKRLFIRPFLLASSLLAVMGVIVLSNFVYGYSVKGNLFVNTALVEEVLHNNAVDGFTWKGSLNVKNIKRELSALQGVSFASVKLVGSRLQVEIKEELPQDTPDALRFEPVTSLYSAVVTRVVAESGTPQVKAGDKVSPGDVLVAPVYAFTEGEAPAPARAEVWGIVTYEKEVILPSYTVESVLTGETFSARSLSVFGKSVGKEALPPFDAYDLEERAIYRAAGIAVTEKIYRRRVSQTIYHDFDAEAPVLLLSAVRELLLSVSFHARERGGVRAVQKKLDNVLYIVVYYSVEQRIDPLFAARSASVEEYG